MVFHFILWVVPIRQTRKFWRHHYPMESYGQATTHPTHLQMRWSNHGRSILGFFILPLILYPMVRHLSSVLTHLFLPLSICPPILQPSLEQCFWLIFTDHDNLLNNSKLDFPDRMWQWIRKTLLFDGLGIQYGLMFKYVRTGVFETWLSWVWSSGSISFFELPSKFTMEGQILKKSDVLLVILELSTAFCSWEALSLVRKSCYYQLYEVVF